LPQHGRILHLHVLLIGDRAVERLMERTAAAVDEDSVRRRASGCHIG